MCVTFTNDMDNEAKDLILEYHQTNDTSRFDLIEANSGQGLVYRIPGHPYVVKIYKDAGKHTGEHFILKQLNDCPYCPKLYAFVDQKFFVMELIEGLTIEEYLNEHKALPVCFYKDLKFALYYFAHTAKFILRDMKVDSSVIIRNDGRVKIIDYGVRDPWDFSSAIMLGTAHQQYTSFLNLMKEPNHQIFSGHTAAEETFYEVLEEHKDTDMYEHFEITNCKVMDYVMERIKELNNYQD